MIINRLCKIGLFEKKVPNNEKGLLIFDFDTNKKNILKIIWNGKGKASPRMEK